MGKNYSSSIKTGDYIIIGIFLLFALIGVFVYVTHPKLVAILLLPVAMVIYLVIMLVPKLSQKLILENNTLHYSSLGLKSWDIGINQIDTIDEIQNNGYVGKLTLGSRGGNTVGFSFSTTTGEQKIVLNDINDYPNFIKDLQNINPQIKTGKVTEMFNQKFLQEARDQKIV